MWLYINYVFVCDLKLSIFDPAAMQIGGKDAGEDFIVALQNSGVRRDNSASPNSALVQCLLSWPIGQIGIKAGADQQESKFP